MLACRAIMVHGERGPHEDKMMKFSMTCSGILRLKGVLCCGALWSGWALGRGFAFCISPAENRLHWGFARSRAAAGRHRAWTRSLVRSRARSTHACV